MELKHNLSGATYTLFCLLAAFLLIPVAGVSQETFRDEFNSIAYNNQDGTVNWSSDWVEFGDTDPGPNAQYLYITPGGQLRLDYLYGENIRRSANLSGATTATLSFDYSSFSLEGTRALGVYISNNGGTSFALIGSLTGSGTFTQNISAYISDNTVLLFAKNGSNWAPDDWAAIDNVQISADLPARLSIANISISEDAGTATFTVTHSGPSVAGPFQATYSTTDGTATSGLDYTAVSGTLSFSGVSGDSQTVVVPLLNDAEYEGDETFVLQIDSVTDPAVNISVTGTATIRDDEIILQDVPLDLYRNLSGHYNYSAGGGTFRTAHNSVDPCAIGPNSSGTLTTPIPAGSTIKEAYLLWSHSAQNPDTQVTLEGSTVNADVVYGANVAGLNFYGYLANVTDIVTALPDPSGNTYDLTDLTIDNSAPYCNGTVVLGAWSLLVFYEHDSLPVSTINLYYGYDISQNTGTTFTLDSFYAISPAGSKATFISYEGDDTLDGSSGGSTNPEELSITNQLGANFVLTGDGGQPGNNAYNSTVYDQLAGVNNSSVYGLDLDTYDISAFINSTDTQVTANVNVGADLIISTAVVLLVPSNLISGTVFEDINYPGGAGRNLANSGGLGIPGATLELYDALGNLLQTTTTDAFGDYTFSGMSDGAYTVRVINSEVPSTRGGGDTCADCYPIQTFRTDYNGTVRNEYTNEIGGANPAATADAPAGTLTAAQTSSTVVISGGGIGGIDFGFNFNTIVNTNDSGQGSLAQFITNSNALDQAGMDIEANALFDPAAGEDVSIFMIPPTGDPLGRTADSGYTGGIFSINLTTALPVITGTDTHIDGRTQTAYSGDTNLGTAGAGGAAVGTAGDVLPVYELPEIQVYQASGDVFATSGDGTVIRNLAILAQNATGVLLSAGSTTLQENLIGTDATGTPLANTSIGVQITGGEGTLDGNYIAGNILSGIWISDTSGFSATGNHITQNGLSTCGANVILESGTGIRFTLNLLEQSGAVNVEAGTSPGGLNFNRNTITEAGQDTTCFGSLGGVGIRLGGSNSSITENLIFNNGNAGIALVTLFGGANLISQNAIYANGTTADALGIDLDPTGGYGDGVTLNDNGDTDSGPNGLLNFPIIVTAYTEGPDLVIKGWARPGTTIEFYLSDISEGTAAPGDNRLGLSRDYGEGQRYIGSVVEGSAADLDTGTSGYSDADGNIDNTSRFEVRFPNNASVTANDVLTALGFLGNHTSEFGPHGPVRIRTIITNRRITYRVNQQ
ncbi:Calx-beta domain-containing protein [Robiginitalea sp. M366]|uniref:Calx-beta domain-containing protein n=1 Tax=Robiginitalea aestuariiviva TaxID=3036903 RepID=UPI00240DDFE4|nr:Calx-beta domain-containing protein [Robiginitalea aestuariiviva]MDG1570683.1 Calx-beta domain-containing protein [Robiginitalea aestuariiviva]